MPFSMALAAPATATTAAQHQASDTCVSFGLMQGQQPARNKQQRRVRQALRPLALGHVVSLDQSQIICLQKGLDLEEASYDSASKIMVLSSSFLTVGLRPFNQPQSRQALIAWTSFIHEARHVYQDKIGLSELAGVEQPRRDKGGATEPGGMLNFSIESDAEVAAIDKAYQVLVVRQHRAADYRALWHNPNNLYENMWGAYWNARQNRNESSAARRKAKSDAFIAWFKDGERVAFYTGNYLGHDTSVAKQDGANEVIVPVIRGPDVRSVSVYVLKISETALGKLLRQNNLSTNALCLADKVAAMAVSRSVTGKDHTDRQMAKFRQSYRYSKPASCDFAFYEPAKPAGGSSDTRSEALDVRP